VGDTLAATVGSAGGIGVLCVSGRGLCNGPINRPEEPYRALCI